jgi:type II secretory pathway pseudopilin PulG
MAALLVGMSVLAVLMSMALPAWSHFAQREKEEELIWRGRQYARAVGLFQRKYANTFPPTIDVLVEQKFLRKKYKDPITKDDFQPIPAGGGGASAPGVIANSREASILSPSGPAGTPPGAQQRQVTATPGPAGGRGAPPATATIQPQSPTGPRQPSIGIQGVVSKSGDSSIKVYNGRTKYNEWAFVYLATAQRVGPGGVQRPGVGVGPQGGQRTPGRPPLPFGPGSAPGGNQFTPPGVQPGQSPFGPPGQAPHPGMMQPFGMPRPNAPPPRPPG